MLSRKVYYLIFISLVVLLPVFLFTSPFAASYLKGLGFIIGALTGLWLVSLAIKDSSIIDIFWGSGFVLMGWFYAWSFDWANLTPRNILFLSLVSIWGLRLTIYLAFRNLGKGEDYRYVQWREQYGENYWWVSYLRVYVLQGWMLWIISACFVPTLLSDAPLGLIEYIGVLIWAIGLLFETVGDWQMMRFKNNPENKGKVLNTGLWKYTRHPNYFGDALVWWGFFCFALAHPQGVWFIFCPAFMTFMLMKISGAAMLEVNLKKTKPAYKEYIERTSGFFPWVPKKA